MTDEELQDQDWDRIEARARHIPKKKDLALEAVLLFYHAGRWDDEHKRRWNEITTAILGPAIQLGPNGGPRHWEATTRVLCDMVRAARTP